jgi:hypothetical protein
MEYEASPGDEDECLGEDDDDEGYVRIDDEEEEELDVDDISIDEARWLASRRADWVGELVNEEDASTGSSERKLTWSQAIRNGSFHPNACPSRTCSSKSSFSFCETPVQWTSHVPSPLSLTSSIFLSMSFDPRPSTLCSTSSYARLLSIVLTTGSARASAVGAHRISSSEAERKDPSRSRSSGGMSGREEEEDEEVEGKRCGVVDLVSF